MIATLVSYQVVVEMTPGQIFRVTLEGPQGAESDIRLLLAALQHVVLQHTLGQGADIPPPGGGVDVPS